MNIEKLDPHYDVILTNTDMTSSIIAAACSRIGKSVLHLDLSSKYGGQWRCLNLVDLVSIKQIFQTRSSNDSNVKIDFAEDDYNLEKLEERQNIFNVHADFPAFESFETIKNFFVTHMKVENFDDESINKVMEQVGLGSNIEKFEKVWETLGGSNRLGSLNGKFNMELCPRMLFANSYMIKVFIDSNITRYLVLNPVARILTTIREESQASNTFTIRNLPLSRNDVFKSKFLKLKEKRNLMKLLMNVQDYKEEETNTSSSFREHLLAFLPEHLCDSIFSSLLMTSDDQIGIGNAMKKLKYLISGIGRFCDRPLLYPAYGSDDILQSFCRYAAVYGATYCLDTPVHGMLVDKKGGQCCSVIIETMTDVKQVECSHLITGYENLSLRKSTIPSFRPSISRAIVCTDFSLTNDDLNPYDGASLLYLPKQHANNIESGVFIIEGNHITKSCPKGLYVHYYWCDSSTNDPQQDLRVVIDSVLESVRISQPSANILWRIFYSQLSSQDGNQEILSSPCNNVYYVSSPRNELDFDHVLEEASRIFHSMYPNEEFFPETNV